MIQPAAFSQPGETVYNRFQYHSYKWEVLHTGAFHIYFPRGYDSLCAFTARELPGLTALIKQRLFSEPGKELNIILYPSVDQLYETNIGSGVPASYALPTVVLKGSRIVAAFDGSYGNLRKQLAEALVRNTWEAQFDNGMGDQLKSTIINDQLPLWCKEGMISYFANGWPIEQEDRLKRSFLQNSFSDWHQVISYQPVLSGTAFCYYLTRSYYRQAAAQLYQQLKKKKDIQRAVRLVTKKSLQETMTDCFRFYRERFGIQEGPLPASGLLNKNSEPIRFHRRKGIVKKLEVSADGNNVAYVLHRNKERTVYIKSLTSGKTVPLVSYKLPPWHDDLSKDPYPLIRWKAGKPELLLVYPRKGKLMLKTFSATGSELGEQILKYIDGVASVQDHEANSLLLAAFRRGQSDIVLYDLRKEKYKAVTNDLFDDAGPVEGGNSGEVFLASKRTIKKQTDIDVPGKDSLQWVQGIFNSRQLDRPLIGDTAAYAQWNVFALLRNGRLLASHTRSGEASFALLDGAGNSTPLGPYRPFSYAAGNNRLYFYTATGDSIQLTSIDADEWVRQTKETDGSSPAPWLQDYISDAAERAKEDSILKAAKNAGGPGFLEGVLKPKDSKELARQRKDSMYKSVQYAPEKINPYVLQLHSAYFTAKVNNDYFINRYQPYANYQGQFKFPETGGMVQGGFTDLLENHHFNMGYRLPAGTEGSDFFVYYRNTKKRTDWSLTYFRKVETLQPDPRRNWVDENGNPYPNTAKVKTHYYELSFHHPFDYYAAADFSTAVRKDRTIFLATEKYSLTFPALKSLWSINTLSYSYDRLQQTFPLLYKGFSGRATLDVFAGLQGLADDAVYGAGISLQYHQPLYKYITAALSLKAGHSGGQQKLLYNMGGVDNNLTVRTDTSVHFNQEAPYAFQTLITPLRGFQQNSLYGNQYALLNADLYFPLFQTLIPIATGFSSINNLQLGLFSDFAYAKETWQSNAAGRFKLSYGFSVRTLLAGYSIRADIALPNEHSKKLLWYLSLQL